jgi:PKD repeat protein
MSQPLSNNRRSLLPLALTLALALAACAFCATAYGTYGDLGKPFGEKGKQKGQFTITSDVHALGVDPTDNSVYVGDEPKEGNESAAEYRIQKFSSSGKFIASASFKVEPVGPEGGYPVGLEGIAVDPTAPGGGRVYALVIYEREEEAGPKLLKEIEKHTGMPRIDGEEAAAGILYAFSTTPSGEQLVPAKNEKGEEFPGGVFASEATLDAQSEVTHNPAASALLEPSGIAVDPTDHDVIILGQEDQGQEVRLTAAQRVNPDGTLGPRWVDVHGCFEGEEESPLCFSEGEGEEVQPGEPTSPVVTQTGHVLVDLPQSEIWEVPSDFASQAVPEPVLRFPAKPLQTLLSFPGGLEPTEGGSLSYVHEASEGASEGRLYQMGELEPGTVLEPLFPAVLSFKLSEAGGALQATEIGFTGGQNKKQHSTCAISALSQPFLAGGEGQAVYVFDPDVGNAEEIAKPHMDVYGPGGSGCLTDSVEPPVATAKGTVVGTAGNPADVNEAVTLSSKLALGNALSVNWDFGDGTTKEVSADQFQTTSVEHAFTAPGTYTVKETVHTDDLAEPTLSTQAMVVVTAAKPTAQFAASANPTAGSPVKFTSTSADPNKSPLVQYVWKFGDGQEETTKTGTVEHTYAAAGKYTVSLQVTDELGLSGSASKELPVAEAAPPPPPPPTTTTTNTPPPTTNTQTTTTSGPTKVPPPAEHSPEAKLASTSLSVTAAGVFTVKISCPAGDTNCSGAITLTTLGAVGAGKKKAVLTLASGSFTIAGGASKSLTLHLSAKARVLLAGSHVLHAKSTIVARDPSGGSSTTAATVTLKAAKQAAHHH